MGTQPRSFGPRVSFWVLGFILAKKKQQAAAPRLQLATSDGGRWMLRTAAIKGDFVEVVTMASVNATLPLSKVRKVEYPQLGAVFLTDLDASSSDYQPYVGSQLTDALKSLYGPRFDVSFDGEPLSVFDPQSASGRRQFQRGLALQSRSQMVYRLAGRFQRFQAMAGIDPNSSSQANVDFRVFADDREIYSRSITKADPAVVVDVDVSSARRLKILVDYGTSIDIGDRLHLGEARLLK